MKLKINKASDLSSFSVLPPQFRRTNATTGPQSSQLRSQPSQQSFSQGLSSQHGVVSQFSQNSLDEVLTNDQRFGSEERENSARKHSFFPPLTFTREDGQIPNSKSSRNVMGKWNSNSNTNRQINETIEHRIGMIETSLNRTGMILDSIQSDIMQVNKGTKEILLEMEGIQKKLMAHDISLQQLNKRQDDVKATIDMGLQSISDKLNRNINQDKKLQEISFTVSTLEERIQASLMKSQNELLNILIKKMQATSHNIQDPKQKDVVAPTFSDEDFGRLTTAKRISHPPKNKVVPPSTRKQASVVPKEEVGGWKSVKAEKPISLSSVSKSENQQKETSSIREHKKFPSRKRMQLERVYRVIIDSDEEINEGFSCLIEDKKDVHKEETQRILRRSSRKKRKCCSPIIIN